MKLKLDWHMVNQVQVKVELTTLIARYSDIFQNELGTIKGISAGIIMEGVTQNLLSTPSTNCTPFKGR